MVIELIYYKVGMRLNLRTVSGEYNFCKLYTVLSSVTPIPIWYSIGFRAYYILACSNVSKYIIQCIVIGNTRSS